MSEPSSGILDVQAVASGPSGPDGSRSTCGSAARSASCSVRRGGQDDLAAADRRADAARFRPGPPRRRGLSSTPPEGSIAGCVTAGSA